MLSFALGSEDSSVCVCVCMGEFQTCALLDFMELRTVKSVMHILMGDVLKENPAVVLCCLGHFTDTFCPIYPWLQFPF